MIKNWILGQNIKKKKKKKKKKNGKIITKTRSSFPNVLALREIGWEFYGTLVVFWLTTHFEKEVINGCG